MIEVEVNGKRHRIDVPSEMPLLWVLRDHLGLTGTKFGCGIAQCGACTVHLDGFAVRACVTPAAKVSGKKVLTIEGLGGPSRLHPLQKAWIDARVPQCGYCQAGQIMSAAALLKKTPQPSPSEITSAMEGNLCRCGTYQRIRSAIEHAAKTLATELP